jgi:hypothetical protein
LKQAAFEEDNRIQWLDLGADRNQQLLFKHAEFFENFLTKVCGTGFLSPQYRLGVLEHSF